jgi:hypothetical protein
MRWFLMLCAVKIRLWCGFQTLLTMRTPRLEFSTTVTNAYVTSQESPIPSLWAMP